MDQENQQNQQGNQSNLEIPANSSNSSKSSITNNRVGNPVLTETHPSGNKDPHRHPTDEEMHELEREALKEAIKRLRYDVQEFDQFYVESIREFKRMANVAHYLTGELLKVKYFDDFQPSLVILVKKHLRDQKSYRKRLKLECNVTPQLASMKTRVNAIKRLQRERSRRPKQSN